jgi:hypothetical protein
MRPNPCAPRRIRGVTPFLTKPWPLVFEQRGLTTNTSVECKAGCRAMASPNADLIVLGKLASHGYGIGGYCLDCRRLFNVSLTVLILERGHDCSPVGMTPSLRCPAPAAVPNTAVIAPSKGG